jgi:hypothetical protein
VERLLNDFRLSILLFMHHFEKKKFNRKLSFTIGK